MNEPEKKALLESRLLINYISVRSVCCVVLRKP